MAPTRKSRKPGAAVYFTVDVAGVRGMQEVLRALPRQIRTQVLQPIMKQIADKGATLARTNLNAMLPTRPANKRRWDRPTGVLAASLGSKVVPATKMRNKDLVLGLYGSRLDFRVPVLARRNVAAIRRLPAGPFGVGRVRHHMTGRTNQSSGAIQPFKYIHLVEKGHRAVPAGISKNTGRPYRAIPAAKPYPFMARSREALNAAIPGILQSQYHHRLTAVTARMIRRYSRRAGGIVA